MADTILPTTFDKSGWHHEQVTRSGDTAVYHRWKTLDGLPVAVHYEVIRIATYPQRTFPNGLTVAAHEVYPSSASWGQMGWTFKTLPEALAFFSLRVEKSA